jgi:hypothetical protein
MELSRVPNGVGRGGHFGRKRKGLPGGAHDARSENWQVAHCRPLRSPNVCFARGRLAAAGRPVGSCHRTLRKGRYQPRGIARLG